MSAKEESVITAERTRLSIVCCASQVFFIYGSVSKIEDYREFEVGMTVK